MASSPKFFSKSFLKNCATRSKLSFLIATSKLNQNNPIGSGATLSTSYVTTLSTFRCFIKSHKYNFFHTNSCPSVGKLFMDTPMPCATAAFVKTKPQNWGFLENNSKVYKTEDFRETLHECSWAIGLSHFILDVIQYLFSAKFLTFTFDSWRKLED